MSEKPEIAKASAEFLGMQIEVTRQLDGGSNRRTISITLPDGQSILVDGRHAQFLRYHLDTLSAATE